MSPGTEPLSRLAISHDRIAEYCHRHHIRKLAVFGSILRDDFRPDSDIDILVEFEPGHVPGLSLVTMEEELSAILGGARVDLVMEKYLNHRIRSRVLREAQTEYVSER